MAKAHLCGDQIRTTGEMQELVKSREHSYLWKAKAKSQHMLSFSASFSQRAREEKNEEPQRAAMNQVAQRARCRVRRPGLETQFFHLLAM